MTTQPTLREIPLSQLRLSPRNTRRSRSAESIESMAASLAAHGLIQNLTVEPCNDDAEAFEVLAGGTRLCALQLRAGRKEIAADLPVMCRIVANGEAVETSAAENLIRTRLSPAEEYDAFRAMADAGKSVADIAAHFGVGEIVVKRSLKLANVDPQLFQIFREGHMELDQLQALALTDDHEAQRKAWFDVPQEQSWMRSAHHLREALTKREVSARNNPLVDLVGLDAYEQAGGPVRRDLFSTRNDAYLGDRALLESLAMNKLEAIAQEHRDAGWSWAEAHLTMDFAALSEYPAGFNRELAEEYLPDDQQQRMDAVQARIDEIEDLDEDELPPAQADQLRDELSELEDERITLENAMRERWPDDVMRQSGVLVYVDYEGLQIAYARLKPGQKLTGEGVVTGKAKATKAGKAADKPKPATLTADLQQRLRLHREAAIRVAIADDTSGAVEMLLASLLSQLLCNGGAGPFDIRATNAHRYDLGQGSRFPDYKASKARKSLDDVLDAVRKSGLPKKASEIQPWLATRTPDQLLNLFSIAAALAFNPDVDQATALARSYAIDMSQWWEPTPEAYLSNVPKALIVEAVQDVHGKAIAAKVAALTKDAAVAEAAKLLAGSGWLPKPLRGHDYKLRAAAKPAATKPAAKPAKKAAGKKAAKKPAKKAAKSVAKKAAKR